ncbi:PREDICTED: zinc finger protein CONSTANS-LIKE 16 [Nelumbo nucifera]|uniref:Zinc finger protein CONSTANS-LIKE 16-like n=2 Tax=Nelumbo nucifera TaxID=4432 RepID=A0A822YX58_NELNU|nr:PREDICTED: zinc finger protein CONSTANS-LIKE 16 [Nelumbo nucifera]DAD35346.1 TPA_asm: hypothetical protein HUJ06_005986 [Nelumbo nucifera]
MSSDKKAANAVGGKTARACDSCLRKRARWYCAADDAFLCQGCDSSVHSANPLARRHERVRLKTASIKPMLNDGFLVENSAPAWHQGFTRKARTPRHVKPAALQPPKVEEPILLNPLPLVPEMGGEESSPDDNEEQLLYRVPIFDPFVAELCTPATFNEPAMTTNDATTAEDMGSERKALLPDGHDFDNDLTGETDKLPVFLLSDMDIAEFAADVETLLGRGLDDDSFGMEDLGLLDCKEEENMEHCFRSGRVKVEVEEVEAVVGCQQVEPGLGMTRESLDLNFNSDSPTTAEEEEVEEKAVKEAANSNVVTNMNSGYKGDKMSSKISLRLRLNYEGVICAWASKGSPWTTGERPQFNPDDDCWPDCMGTYPMEVYHHHPYGEMGGVGGHVTMGNGGREARVSRYREKRRTRLFSKKIRYEVRKLNAEKRPRMKGRFVKRTSLMGVAAPFPF